MPKVFREVVFEKVKIKKEANPDDIKLVHENVKVFNEMNEMKVVVNVTKAADEIKVVDEIKVNEVNEVAAVVAVKSSKRAKMQQMEASSDYDDIIGPTEKCKRTVANVTKVRLCVVDGTKQTSQG